MLHHRHVILYVDALEKEFPKVDHASFLRPPRRHANMHPLLDYTRFVYANQTFALHFPVLTQQTGREPCCGVKALLRAPDGGRHQVICVAMIC